MILFLFRPLSTRPGGNFRFRAEFAAGPPRKRPLNAAERDPFQQPLSQYFPGNSPISSQPNATSTGREMSRFELPGKCPRNHARNRRNRRPTIALRANNCPPRARIGPCSHAHGAERWKRGELLTDSFRGRIRKNRDITVNSGLSFHRPPRLRWCAPHPTGRALPPPPRNGIIRCPAGGILAREVSLFEGKIALCGYVGPRTHAP